MLLNGPMAFIIDSQLTTATMMKQTNNRLKTI